ncbi:MAG: hypothetical protein LBU48_06610 [Coriobacteriales bacterium]|nr:hypothetical protein [Coriobacteriales bacterium]
MLERIDASMLAQTRALFSLSSEELFAQARACAGRYSQTITAAPLILTGDCTTDPPCRHCKWKHLRVIKPRSFTQDRPLDELIAHMRVLVNHGIARVFIATGWLGYRLPRACIDTIVSLREALPTLELFGLFGALDRQSHVDLASAGLDGMLTSLESPNEAIFKGFRPGGDTLSSRLEALAFAREAGLTIWTGFLMGLGEDEDDVARGIELIRPFEPQSLSILPFEPFAHTPMEHHPACDSEALARANAVARIALPTTEYFFSDRLDNLGQEYARQIGINGFYETRIE